MTRDPLVRINISEHLRNEEPILSASTAFGLAFLSTGKPDLEPWKYKLSNIVFITYHSHMKELIE